MCECVLGERVSVWVRVDDKGTGISSTPKNDPAGQIPDLAKTNQAKKKTDLVKKLAWQQNKSWTWLKTEVSCVPVLLLEFVGG